MDTGKFIGLLVFFLVGALVLVAFVPVIQETTSATDTFTNDGAFFVELDPTDAYSIEYDKAVNPGVVYINDVAMDIPFTTGYTIMALDTSIMRLQSGDSTIQYKGAGQYITGINKLNLTVVNGNVTGTFRTISTPEGNPDATWPTTTYTKCYIASPTEQELIMTEYSTVNKVKGDSDIFAFGQTLIQSESSYLVLVNIEGTITDGVEVSILDPTSGNVLTNLDVTDVSINKTPVSGYIGLYDLSSITFKVTDGEYTTDVSYSAYIIPAEVTAEKTIHADTTLATVINLLPLIAGIGLLMFLIGEFLYTRYL